LFVVITFLLEKSLSEDLVNHLKAAHVSLVINH
jgi:hypothetical protein